MRAACPMLLVLMCAACGAEAKDTGAPSLTEDGAGLPQGTTRWTGEGLVSGLTFPLVLTLDNGGPDLAASVTISDAEDLPTGIGEGTFTLVGTHAPQTGGFALAPTGWSETPAVPIELMGATGTHDPAAGTLTGQLRDWSDATDNTLRGGSFTLSLEGSGDRASKPGDGAHALPTGTVAFTGTGQCTGDPREMGASLIHDGEGGITGTITVGDRGLDTPLGTFPVDGTHNPTTGTITVAPQPWLEPAPSNLNFMVSGTYDPATGMWTGDQLTNTAACPARTWLLTLVSS